MNASRLLHILLPGIFLAATLAACGGGGTEGKAPAAVAPEYVEAGLVVYDSIQLQGLLPDSPLLQDLQAAALETQALPLGHQALLKVFWKGVPEAEGYRVFLRETGGTENEIASLGATSTELTIADILPQFGIEEGRTYETGVAIVSGGKAGRITWSWPLQALGAIKLTAPGQNSDQPQRPPFVWSNARGNPSVAEISVADANNQLVLNGMWPSTPLPSTATPDESLSAGRCWVVVNGGGSQAIQDPRMQLYFPTGHTVLSLPAPLSFTVGGGGDGGGGGGGGGGDGGGGSGGGGGGGSYNIELRFGPSITEAQKQMFRAAAARWEQVVIGDLSDVRLDKPVDACGENEPAESGMVDDLIIYAEVGEIDGPGNTLGYAGPCALRIDNGLTIYGIMRFDSADIGQMEADGNFPRVILHEMGHVLGVGTLWERKGLLQYAGSDCYAANSIEFTGAGAHAEWIALAGSGGLPIENDYGPGTKCGHWSEAVFDHELLTGFAEAGGTPMPLSRMTIASLADLGYQVNMAAAEPYQLPACSPACLRTAGTQERLPHTILLEPRFEVEADGTLIELGPRD